MSLSLPSMRVMQACLLLQKVEVVPRHFRFTLHAPDIADAARPGQFVHVLPRSVDALDPLLRRAFSLLAVDEHQGTIELLFRAGGRGTQMLSQFVEGETIDVLGPLGQPFDTSPFHVKQEDVRQANRAIVVGGGVGVPPLIFLAKYLSEKDVEVKALIGARGSGEVLGEDDFAALQVPFAVATDDGSRGHHGRVTDLLEQDLENSAQTVVYACGPWPMLRAVAALCARFEVRCQVSLEENMPCGIGVCNGCVVRAREPFAREASENADEITPARTGSEWSVYERYRRVCVEGPACWADEIDWS